MANIRALSRKTLQPHFGCSSMSAMALPLDTDQGWKRLQQDRTWTQAYRDAHDPIHAFTPLGFTATLPDPGDRS